VPSDNGLVRSHLVPLWEWADYGGPTKTKAIPAYNRPSDPERVAAIAAVPWAELVAVCARRLAQPMSDEMFNRVCVDMIEVVQRVRRMNCACSAHKSWCFACRMKSLLDDPPSDTPMRAA